MSINCIVCHKTLKSSESIYGTICGHIGHYDCILRSQRFKKCPICKQLIDTEEGHGRVYLEKKNGIEEEYLKFKYGLQLNNLTSELNRERAERAYEVDKLEKKLEQTVSSSKREKTMLEKRINDLVKKTQSDNRNLIEKLAILTKEKDSLQIRITELQKMIPGPTPNSVIDSNKENLPATSSVKPKIREKKNSAESKRIKVDKLKVELNTVEPKKENSTAVYTRKYNLRPR